jgi:hypothetical protein
MGEIYAQIRALGDANYMECSALTYIAQEIAKYIEVQRNVQQVELGVEALLQGQLSPKLLSVELVTQILENVTRELEQNSYYLCYETPQDLYESRNLTTEGTRMILLFDFGCHILNLDLLICTVQ